MSTYANRATKSSANLFPPEQPPSRALAVIQPVIPPPPEAKPDLEPESEYTDFDWEKHSDDIVQYASCDVAMYFNNQKFRVIRRRRYWDEEDDAFISISPGCQEAFLERLTQLMGVPTFP
jgi:hypothetical protein